MSLTRINISSQSFTQPAVGSTVDIIADPAIRWFPTGMLVYIFGGGFYEVENVVQFTITLKLKQAIASPGAIVNVSYIFPVPATFLSLATDTGVMHLTGDETVAGIKTFQENPVIPNAQNSNQAASKGQLDDAINPINTSIANINSTLAKGIRVPQPIDPSAGIPWPAANAGDTFLCKKAGVFTSSVPPGNVTVQAQDLVVCIQNTVGGDAGGGAAPFFIADANAQIEIVSNQQVHSSSNETLDWNTITTPAQPYVLKISSSGYLYQNPMSAFANFTNIDPRMHEGFFISYDNPYTTHALLWVDCRGDIYVRGVDNGTFVSFIFINEKNIEQYSRHKSVYLTASTYTVADKIHTVYCTVNCTVTLPDPTANADREIRIVAVNCTATFSGYTVNDLNAAALASITNSSILIKSVSGEWLQVG